MKRFYKKYQNENPELFNEEFIYQKKNDDVLSYVKAMCEAVEIVEGIKFLEAKIDRDEKNIKTLINADGKKFMNLNESRLDRVIISFLLHSDPERPDEVITREFLVPKIVDDFFFIINGIKYFPIYQIIDSATYKTNKEDKIVQKTMFMPLPIESKKKSIKDVDGNEHIYNSFYFSTLFRKNMITILFYLAEMGINKTLEFFDIDSNEITFFDSKLNPEVAENKKDTHTQFRISSSVGVMVANHIIGSQQQNYIFMILETLSNRIVYENLFSQEYWCKQLGKEFTTNMNAQIDKGMGLINSFQRVLDNHLKQTLRIDPKHKGSTFALVKWMLVYFDYLKNRNNMDLHNKRLRVMEYVLYPLILMFSNVTYRLNKPNPTYEEKMQYFKKLKPGFLLKELNNDLLRYNGAVNAMDLFNAGLKASFRGPNSFAENGKNVPIEYRGLHKSYVGRISLGFASAGDPGLSVMFTPFLQTDGFFFSDEGIMYDFENENK